MLTDRTRTEIEKALAFGHSTGWIEAHLGVTATDVADTRTYLEAVNALPDEQPHVTRDQLDQLAREELASIYGQTVREHHNQSTPPLPPETAWEQAQLRRAARNLRRAPDDEETA